MTVVGYGPRGYDGDGGSAIDCRLYHPADVFLGPTGRLYIADKDNHCIRMVGSLLTFSKSMTDGQIAFAEKDGTGHILSSAGKHIRTIDIDSGAALYRFDYDEDGGLVSIKDRLGNESVIERSGPLGAASAFVSPDGLRTMLARNADGRLERIIHPDGSFYSFEYTPDGLLTSKTDPGGNRFDHVFDSEGRLTDSYDEEGGHWHYTSQKRDSGEVISEATIAEGDVTTYIDNTDSFGAFTSTIIDPAGAETLYSKSPDGLIVNKSLPCGMNMEIKYDFNPLYEYLYAKKITQVTPSGLEKVGVREKEYVDSDGDETPDLITSTFTENGKTRTILKDMIQSQRIVTSPEGRQTTVQVAPDTLAVRSVSVPGLFTTTYGCDDAGRLTSIDAGSRSTTFAFNEKGFLESFTTPDNSTTSFTHDAVGRVTRVDRTDGGSVSFTHDGNGNMTMLTTPLSIDHAFGYNSVNRNTSYSAPLSGVYSYEYDKDRRLIRTNFPSGKQIVKIYDKNRLTRVRTPEGDIDYTYLCGSKVESIKKGAESISLAYDGNLLTSVTMAGTLDQNRTYSYNDDFKPVAFSYAGKSITYAYVNDGFLIAASGFTISRDTGNGLPVGVGDGVLNLTRSFNGHAEKTGQEVAVVEHSLMAWSLVKNDAGRITNKSETMDGSTSAFAYTYDPMGRLLTVAKNGTLVEEYRYNANGPRVYELNTALGVPGRTFTYSEEDHILTAGPVSYLYDHDGFLVSRTEGSSVTRYGYSSRGELLSVVLPDGALIEYVHDPLGRRIAKKVDGIVVEKYLWQGLTRLLAVYDGSDNLIMRFEYADGRMPFALTIGNDKYYLVYDQVGSLRMVADTAGNVVKRIDYDSFGNIIHQENPAFEIPVGFAGGLHDRDTKLVRFGYRDYDPEIGRWTAKDPIFFRGGDTDLYGYCLNDPVNLIDPSGKHGKPWGHSHSNKETNAYAETNHETGHITYHKDYDELPKSCQQSIDFHELMHKDYPTKSEQEVWYSEMECIQEQIDMMDPDDPNRIILEAWLEFNKDLWEEGYGYPCPLP